MHILTLMGSNRPKTAQTDPNLAQSVAQSGNSECKMTHSLSTLSILPADIRGIGRYIPQTVEPC